MVIPGSGIPSDWSILTDLVNTWALLMPMGYAITMAVLRDPSMRDAVFKSVLNNMLKIATFFHTLFF